MKMLQVEFQTRIRSGLFKLIFVATLLILSVILEKWQNF